MSDFLKRSFRTDPRKRATMYELANHPWLNIIHPAQRLPLHELPLPIDKSNILDKPPVYYEIMKQYPTIDFHIPKTRLQFEHNPRQLDWEALEHVRWGYWGWTATLGEENFDLDSCYQEFIKYGIRPRHQVGNWPAYFHSPIVAAYYISRDFDRMEAERDYNDYCEYWLNAMRQVCSDEAELVFSEAEYGIDLIMRCWARETLKGDIRPEDVEGVRQLAQGPKRVSIASSTSNQDSGYSEGSSVAGSVDSRGDKNEKQQSRRGSAVVCEEDLLKGNEYFKKEPWWRGWVQELHAKLIGWRSKGNVRPLSLSKSLISRRESRIEVEEYLEDFPNADILRIIG